MCRQAHEEGPGEAQKEATGDKEQLFAKVYTGAVKAKGVKKRIHKP